MGNKNTCNFQWNHVVEESLSVNSISRFLHILWTNTEIYTTQCRKLAIFLPLLFYVQSITFAWFQNVKNCQCDNFGGSKLWYFGYFILENVKNSKYRATEMVKNWFHVKFEGQKIHWFPQHSVEIWGFSAHCGNCIQFPK